MWLKDGFIRDDFMNITTVFNLSPVFSIMSPFCPLPVRAHQSWTPLTMNTSQPTVIDQGGSWLRQCGHWWSLVLPPLSLSTGRIKIKSRRLKTLWNVCFQSSSRHLKKQIYSEIFDFRAVAGFLAGVKASHHSTDKESLDRLDLGVTQFEPFRVLQNLSKSSLILFCLAFPWTTKTSKKFMLLPTQPFGAFQTLTWWWGMCNKLNFV